MANGIGDSSDDVVRAPKEVARRAIGVFMVVCAVFRDPKDELFAWLEENGLSDVLAPSERAFLETKNPSQRQSIDASWISERLIVLCWALRLADELPGADEKCDPVAFLDMLPPYADVEVSDFIDEAVLRPEAELVAMADTILQQHWHARDAKLKGTPPRIAVDVEIIQERHHAINWIIGYDGAPWDEVAADT